MNSRTTREIRQRLTHTKRWILILLQPPKKRQQLISKSPYSSVTKLPDIMANVPSRKSTWSLPFGKTSHIIFTLAAASRRWYRCVEVATVCFACLSPRILVLSLGTHQSPLCSKTFIYWRIAHFSWLQLPSRGRISWKALWTLFSDIDYSNFEQYVK